MLKRRSKENPHLEPLLLRYKPCKPATKLEWLPQIGDLKDLRSRFGFQVPMDVEYLPAKPPCFKPVSIRTRSVVQYLQALCDEQAEYQRSVFTDPQERMMELAVDPNNPWCIFNTEKRRLQWETKKIVDPLVTKQEWTEFHGLFPPCCDQAKLEAKERLYGLKKKKPQSQYRSEMKLAEAWSRRLNRLSAELQRLGKHDYYCALVRLAKIQINQERQNRHFEMLRQYEEMTDPRRLTMRNLEMKRCNERTRALSREIKPVEVARLPEVRVQQYPETSETHVPNTLAMCSLDPEASNGRQQLTSSGDDCESNRDNEITQCLDLSTNRFEMFDFMQ